jgi:hypothetical protein
MQIFIKNLNGKRVIYEVHPTDTILSVKRQVREKEGMPLRRIRLIYAGKFLENDETLSNYKILKESTFQLMFPFDGGSYCIGCIRPALICLSAHVSLQCGKKLTFDNEQLLHSIKTKLISLNNGIKEAIMNCIETCGHEWDYIENDDAEYFRNHAEQRQIQAINEFTGAICRIINPYIEKYRTLNMLKSTQVSIYYKAAYQSTLTEPIDIDWLTFLHETRCPICFCRFSNVQLATNVPNRYIIDDF